MSVSKGDTPKSILIIYNISNDHNFGWMVRTANAMGVSEVLVVGRQKFNKTGHMGTDGGFATRRHFYRIEEAVDYLKEGDFTLVGVEITLDAKPIESQPFTGNTAFLMGNEGTGISEKAKSFCESFVYIKQFGDGASLNVNVATGIVLHHFSLWAGFKQNAISGEKFIPDVSETKKPVIS